MVHNLSSLITIIFFKMKFSAFLLLLIMFGCNLFAQPFQIGHTTITLFDLSRNNRSIPTEIYYPADVAGINVPVTTLNNDKFPVIAFGHGFVMTWDAYQNIWDAVVPEGFVIAFPKTETGFSPSHAEFGKDLAFVISELSSLGQNNSSLFYNRIDSMNCVMGHSMGGGSSFLAAQFYPGIKSLVALSPAETNPSAIQASTYLTIPSLIYAGGNDCVTPPATNQIPMYDSLNSSCKMFISIIGGSHCQMAENNLLCNFGESSCTPQPTISRADQHLVINRYLLPWLKFELNGDCFSGVLFDSLISNDANINFQKSCVLCAATTAIDAMYMANLEVYPNPFSNKIMVNVNQSDLNNVHVDVCRVDGLNLPSNDFVKSIENEKLIINLNDNLPTGIYFLHLSMAGMTSVKKMIKF